MKSIQKIIVLSMLLIIPFTVVLSKGNSTVVVNYVFKHINKGYDHLSKTKVFVDGEVYAVSTEKKQSKKNSFKVKIPKGNHEVRIVNYALYEGNWEEHTVENNYSYDCVYELNQNFKKRKYTVDLVFDLDNGVEAKVK